MRSVLAVFLLLSACSTIDRDPTTSYFPAAIHTQVTFEPLDLGQAQSYIETERHLFKTNTDPLRERVAGLEKGREERYKEIHLEFPQCDRQKHCLSHISRGDVKHFERFSDLAKEIHAYDQQIVELEATIHDWAYRFELRQRAILNRYLVHEVLQIASSEQGIQKILAYSLESFDTRRQASLYLMRFAGNDVVPTIMGDLNFRMLSQPIDQAAVVATFEVNLLASANEENAPNRYLVSILVNTHQLDLHFYNEGFLRSWAAKLSEPYQVQLRQQVLCSLYSIANETLAPRLDSSRPMRCARARSEMQSLDANRMGDRFPPERWMLPLAYYPTNRSGVVH